MLDYTRRMRLSLSDKIRRAGISAGAAIVALIGMGFLLAALWTWLAHELDWGSAMASLAIGGALTLIGLLVLVFSGRSRHETPSPQELRDELEQKLGVAADVVIGRVTGRVGEAVDKVQTKASHLASLAENRFHSLSDQVSYQADRFAEGAEWKAHDLARKMGDAAAKVGLTAERVSDVGNKVSAKVDAAKNSNLAAVAPVVGAFAVGMTLASRLQSWRHGDEDRDISDNQADHGDLTDLSDDELALLLADLGDGSQRKSRA